QIVPRRHHRASRSRRAPAGVARRDGRGGPAWRRGHPHARRRGDDRRGPRCRASRGRAEGRGDVAVTEALAAFRWRDAVDIALVAIVVYRILVMFRGTRAVQMLTGLACLVAGSLLARLLELYSTQWILDNFWSFWVIALVVLFQPELRRALARIGEGRVLANVFGASRAERAHVIDEIVDAVESLTARRIGALVVIERSAGLGQYAELGVALDALVSADLLVSVFLPYSPLHDGAVFVQGNRVVAAGC